MLTVRATLAHSSIHGIGLFAETFIPRGSTIWVFNPVLDQRFTRRRLRAMAATQPEEVLVHFCTYSYKRGGRFWYMGDNARFINHEPVGANIALADDLHEVALRDIHAGEELVENYFDNYDPDDFFVLEQERVDFGGWLRAPAVREVRHVAC
jgi:hypothetical protein